MMYGFIPAADWVVSYTTDTGLIYYISDFNDDVSVITWTQKTKIARRFASQQDCDALIDRLQRQRNDKRKLTPSQV